ncbi:MAG TPA: carbohydrate kinase family protein [Anaerovoracaceae bacterium]|nr:carbohydrate kinase family protein [Anaerovoracaceae bacterium]
MVECVIFGGLLLDKYLEVETYPERGQDGLITDEFNIAGGCSINMAATFNNLGGSAYVVSYIGADQTGREIMDYLDRHGLSAEYVKQIEGDTGYSLVILEKNGERTFLTKKGVEARFDRELLRPYAGAIPPIKNVMVTGYYLLCDNTPELVMCLSEIREQCDHFLFDPGPLVREIDPDALKKAVSMADIITMNEAEAENIDLPKDASKIIVIKKGKSGGEVFYGGERFGYKAAAVEEADTTGAGDSFNAGLMFGILSGMDVRSSVSLAAESAAITVTVKGPHGFWKR